MDRKIVKQRIHYLSEQDVRDAVFHWLHTVGGCPPHPEEKMTVTGGMINPITITYTSDLAT